MIPKPESIRVLSWRGRWGEALAQAVSRPFTQQTGIRIDPVFHVGLHLPASLVAALEQGAAPPVDVVWCNSAPALRAAANGWSEPLQDLGMGMGMGMGAPGMLRERARRIAGADWPLVPAYAVHYVLVYQASLYADAPPRSWEALLDPRHAGSVVLYPGGNGFYPVAQLLGGGRVEDMPLDMSPCWTTVAGMRGQLGAPDYSIGLETRIARGGIDLCYRALPNALAFQAAGLKVGWTAPCEGVADTTDSLWIPRGLGPDTAYWARQYIAFALSPAVQEQWCKLLGALPMHAAVPAPPLLRAHARLPRHADDTRGVLFVPESVKAAHEPEWEARFDAVLRGDSTIAANPAPMPGHLPCFEHVIERKPI